MNVSKNVCDGEYQLFWNEGEILSLWCKNINVLLNYSKVGIYLKHCECHALWSVVKIW